jgi:regulator of protease activity HflC (stomatin/prohibitin superfamily)
MQAIVVLVGLLMVLVLVVAFMGVRVIAQSHVMIIERLGKYKRTLTGGVSFIIPFVDKARPMLLQYAVERPDGPPKTIARYVIKIDLRESVFDFPRQNVITSDNVAIEINALLYYQISDPPRAMYEIQNLPDAISKLTQTTLRNVIGGMDLDQTLTSRDRINAHLKTILDEATDKWGVKVNRVEIQDIIPPADIRAAMEKQMRAERDRRAAILEAEGLKQAAILSAEGEQQSAVKRAEGNKQAAILNAEGEARARIATAEAERDALKLISSALGGDFERTAKYMVSMRYISELHTLAGGDQGRLVFMPYEASGFVASVGALNELLGKPLGKDAAK